MSDSISGAGTTSGAVPVPESGPVAVPDLRPQIIAALNTIDRIKRDPELSKRIAETIGPVITPFTQPLANIKRGLLNTVTVYKQAPPKVVTAKTGKTSKVPLAGGMFAYGTTRGGKKVSTKTAKVGKSLAPQMIQITTPSALDRALTSLANIETNLATMGEINTAVANINTNLSELLDLSKAGTPAATPAGNNANNTTNNSTNNSQEGGRRRQTKGKRRGRGTRR